MFISYHIASLLKEELWISNENLLKISLKKLKLSPENFTLLFQKFQILGPLYWRECLPASEITLLMVWYKS